jgi:hypothetical protein
MTENCKFLKAILSAFYNILQRNFGILLILWCSFKLWWNFSLDQNLVYNANGPLMIFVMAGAKINLVPRACDPWEGNEGSGIIRCRKPGILAKIELRIHFNGQSDSSLKRIIPEPSFPSQGSQARGTRLGQRLDTIKMWHSTYFPNVCVSVIFTYCQNGGELRKSNFSALLYVNYSAYEQLVFIFGKIRLLAIEWHAFHAKWRKNKNVRGRLKMLVKIAYFHLCA